MKLKVLEDFIGSEDGINSKNYITDQEIDVDKEFADIIVNRGYAKALEPTEIKKTRKKKEE